MNSSSDTALQSDQRLPIRRPRPASNALAHMIFAPQRVAPLPPKTPEEEHAAPSTASPTSSVHSDNSAYYQTALYAPPHRPTLHMANMQHDQEQWGKGKARACTTDKDNDSKEVMYVNRTGKTWTRSENTSESLTYAELMSRLTSGKKISKERDGVTSEADSLEVHIHVNEIDHTALPKTRDSGNSSTAVEEGSVTDADPFTSQSNNLFMPRTLITIHSLSMPSIPSQQHKATTEPPTIMTETSSNPSDPSISIALLKEKIFRVREILVTRAEYHQAYEEELTATKAELASLREIWAALAAEATVDEAETKKNEPVVSYPIKPCSLQADVGGRPATFDYEARKKQSVENDKRAKVQWEKYASQIRECKARVQILKLEREVDALKAGGERRSSGFRDDGVEDNNEGSSGEKVEN